MLHIVKNIGALGYIINAVSYLVLILLLLTSWEKKWLGGLLIAASAYEVIWSLILSIHAYANNIPHFVMLLNEDIRLAIWLYFLIEVLRLAGDAEINRARFLYIKIMIVLLPLAATVFNYIQYVQGNPANNNYSYIVTLIMAIAGLILTEQLYRNTKPDKRWAIKYLCIGIGVLFAYDLYMYSDATLLERIDLSLWNARGYVNLVVVPLLAISAARNPKWSVNVFVSRHVVFYSSSLFAIGIYMTLMAIGGYYVKIYGGEWGDEAQVIFLAGAIIVLFVILSSGTFRAKLKLFLNKHFYKNKYDYREEWMGFIQKISHIDSPKYLKEQILQTVAMMMHSRGAVLYLREDQKYKCMSVWNADSCKIDFDEKSSLVGFLNNREWIVDVGEYRAKPAKYPSLDLPDEISEIHGWLIAPLKHYYDLIGFIILLEPFINIEINWEDRDLLKAISKQISSYLAFMMATESLAEAEKFAAFNRLSAFVVHDMKNSVAQLDLIVKNAEKHKNNPEFISDAFLTVTNVVDRMQRMLAQLKRIDLNNMGSIRVNVCEAIFSVAEKCSNRKPIPEVLCEDRNIYINTEYDRFLNVIEHLLTNAQDATSEQGSILVRVQKNANEAHIEIEDTGSGMSPEFVSNHLFKPFYTTKGNAGMGVGVFEAKEFVKYFGGHLDVKSTLGAGTIFCMTLPLHSEGVSIEPKFA